PDGESVTCNGTYKPGERIEICNNNLDDDCDGDIDEFIEIVDGKEKIACGYEQGMTKSCGSNIGECKSGIMTCYSKVCIGDYGWGPCEGKVGPKEEVCNGKDDDCDGIIDDVNGGNSIEESRCACFNGESYPGYKTEICNDIDDDCDGEIDEGISCCSEGTQRPCGSDIGECRPGVQTCRNGEWGPCEGGVQPRNEICYDNKDNDCDGEVDEQCTPEITCYNGIQDLNEDGIDCGGPCEKECEVKITLPWILIATGSIILIVVISYLLMQRIR
ncbi:MAG: hypothetical protein DRP15_02510, partial [Candidatus Aenigmatarchaeota archaeon]